MFNQIFILYIDLLSLSYKQKWWYFQISNLQKNSGGYQRISFIHDEWEMCCPRRILPTLELLIMFTKCVHTYTCTVVDREQEMEDFFTVNKTHIRKVQILYRYRDYIKLKEKRSLSLFSLSFSSFKCG